MIKKWKEEWLRRNETKLSQQFEKEILTLVDSFDKTKKQWESKISSLDAQLKQRYETLLYKQTDIEELSKRLEERKLELATQNENLKSQLRVLEAKSSPSGVWVEAFSLGFSKAWDMMLPIMTGGIDRLKKSVEDRAIEQTIERLNGNHKKIN